MNRISTRKARLSIALGALALIPLLSQAQSRPAAIESCPSFAPTMTAYDGNGAPGPTVQPGTWSYIRVNVGTQVTVSVDGVSLLGRGGYVWSISGQSSYGPATYSSSNNGNTLYITPYEPTSLLAPNGTTNGDQYYHINCTATDYCGRSAELEYGVYSIPPGGMRNAVGPPTAALTAYPNPANERVVVTVAAYQEADVLLYNQYGVLQKQLRVNGALELPTQELPTGVYYLRVKTDKGIFTQKRIFIQH